MIVLSSMLYRKVALINCCQKVALSKIAIINCCQTALSFRFSHSTPLSIPRPSRVAVLVFRPAALQRCCFLVPTSAERSALLLSLPCRRSHFLASWAPAPAEHSALPRPPCSIAAFMLCPGIAAHTSALTTLCTQRSRVAALTFHTPVRD